MEIRSRIHEFLAKTFREHTLQDDTDIFATGFVNSLFAMQLVMFIESTFNLTIEDEDLNIDNFRTVNAMTTLVERKLG